MKALMYVPFFLVLKPLIKRNYKLRYESKINGDNKHPDQWYWADKLSARYGYFTSMKALMWLFNTLTWFTTLKRFKQFMKWLKD